MDADTKLILGAWRGVLVENYRLQCRVADLEEMLEKLNPAKPVFKGHTNVGKRIDDGWSDVYWRRVGRGRRDDADSSD